MELRFFEIYRSAEYMELLAEGATRSLALAVGGGIAGFLLASLIAAAGESIWRAFSLKGSPPITRHAAMAMSRDCILIGDKARDVLGYRPVISREQGFAAQSNAARA